MIYTEPADIDVGEANYPGPQDGAEVVVMDWDGEVILVTKNAAVDTAYGILHLAGETAPAAKKESVLDPTGMFVGFVLVTLLVGWSWIVWHSLTYWTT